MTTTIEANVMTPEKRAEEVALALPKKGELVGEDTPYGIALRAFSKEMTPIVDEARRLTEITTHDQAERATELGRLLHVGAAERTGFFKRIKQAIDALKEPVLDDEKRVVGPIQDEKGRLGRLQTTYDQKVQREKEEADRLARAESERIAREEQIARAIELEEEGDVEQAEATLNEHIHVPHVTTQVQSTPKIAGKVSKVSYSATVQDLKKLVAAVAAGKVPIQAIQANESFINGQARLMREGFDIPGCKLNVTQGTHYRG